MGIRVSLFFDGYNFNKRLQTYNSSLKIDYARLASWVVGSISRQPGAFTGAHYYRGYRESDDKKLDGFLAGLSLREGFFVHREPLVLREVKCDACNTTTHVLAEKRVDVRLASDMIHFAAVDSYDIAVLLSGDEDFIPAVEAVQRLGKKVYLARLTTRNISPELRKTCFGELDLSAGVASFKLKPKSSSHTDSLKSTDDTPRVEGAAGLGAAASTVSHNGGLPEIALQQYTQIDVPVELAQVLKDVRRAYKYYLKRGGYLSKWHFCHRWTTSSTLTKVAEERTDLLERLSEAGLIQFYLTFNSRGNEDEAIRPL